MESLQEKQNISLLLDIYGGLLTERQRDFLDLYYNEDLSYGEIAESEDISRQAVHDTIQHGKKALLHFDEHLRLSAKVRADSTADTENQENISSLAKDMEALRKEIGELSRLVSVDFTYDMIPIQRQVKKIRELAGM